MLYRRMKKTGDDLSILGFGCMRLPVKRGRIDEPRAKKQLRYAIDKGVNYVDTAMPYHMGASEPFLGRALEDGYREKVKVATKLPHWSVKKADDMDRLLAAQLESLKTECIDYYLIHALTDKSWQKMQRHNVMEFLNRAKADGRIANAGFSFHDDREAFKTIVDGFDWDFCQIQYNYLDTENQAGTEGLKYAAAKDLGVIIMEPLRGGNLARKVPKEIDRIWNEAEKKRSPVEWALRWIWNHPEVTVVLSGMNEEDHIEENLRIADEAVPDSLTADELVLVDRVADEYRRLMKVGCTGCQYCMPCPEGVDIPGCFEIYNNASLFGDKTTARLFYLSRLMGAMAGEQSYASLCKECGKCMVHCPQHLQIPDLLKDVADEFEGPGLKAMGWIVQRVLAVQRFSALRRGRSRK